jgi:hypothetical protein
LLPTVTNENPNGFVNIPPGFTPPAGSGKKYFKLINPVSGLAFDLEGPDSHALSMPQPPKLNSEDAAAEMAELYWMAILRDVDFRDFRSNNRKVKKALRSLSQTFMNYPNWPTDSSGNMTISTLCRGNFEGDLVGPFVSQFLLKGNKDEVLRRDERQGFIKFGSDVYDHRIVGGLKDRDYLTHFDSWLAVQNGEDRSLSLLEGDRSRNVRNYYDRMRRFISNMRDLASYVHFDLLYQAYLIALIYFIRLPEREQTVGGQPLLDPGNPYLGTNPNYTNQQGFGTFGASHILSLVTEVATRALKAAWYQKWFVHRRLRPEAFGGLVHLKKIGTRNYPIHNKLMQSDVLDEIAKLNKHMNKKYRRRDGQPAPKGNYYLLPSAFPEGSPTHPSYPAGHATVAGACVTILKAWFNEEYPIKKPVIAVQDGKKLDNYNGPGKDNLTLGGELNKLAANIAIGRNMAGVHYRSDYIESVKLGERVAIGILQDQRKTYLEDGYSLTLKAKYRFVDTTSDVVISS